MSLAITSGEFVWRMGEIAEGDFGSFPDPARLAKESLVNPGEIITVVSLGELEDVLLAQRYARGEQQPSSNDIAKLALTTTIASQIDREDQRMFFTGACHYLLKTGNSGLTVAQHIASIDDSSRFETVTLLKDSVLFHRSLSAYYE